MVTIYRHHAAGEPLPSAEWNGLVDDVNGMKPIVDSVTSLNARSYNITHPSFGTAVAESSPSSAYGAQNAIALQAAIDTASSAGGGTVIIPGKFALDRPMQMKTGVLLIGAGASAYESAYSSVYGSGLFWRGTTPTTRANTTAYAQGARVFPATPNGMFYEATTAGTSAGSPPTFPTQFGATVTDGTVVWTNRGHYALIQWGNNAQTTDLVGAGIEHLTLDGNSDANLQLIAIRSNTPTSAAYVTRRGTISHCVLRNGGTGIQWGNTTNESSYSNEQADFFVIEQADFYHMVSRGVVIDGANCADNSWFHVCPFSDCAPSGQPYIEIKRGGYIIFDGVNGGGDTGVRDLFEFGTLCTGIEIRESQSEGMRNFIHVASTNNVTPTVTLIKNTINDNVHIQGIRYFVGIGNDWSAGKLLLDRVGCSYHAHNDSFASATSSYVRVLAGGMFINRRTPSASTLEYLNAGEIINQALPVSGMGTFDQVVVRAGQRRATWAAATAYSAAGGGYNTWKPGEAITTGNVRLARIPDGFKYTAGNNGTTGATLADEPFWDVARTVADAAGITWTPSANTDPTIVVPTVDNGHAYRVLVAGTSHASTEPTWPTGDGATVTDNTVTWQETGPSALVVTRVIHPEGVGSSAPATGQHLRGEITWNNGLNAGSFVGYACYTAGTPGSHLPFAHTIFRRVITTTPFTLTATSDVRASVNVASASTVNLPATGNVDGDEIIICDLSGASATNSITVQANGSGNINKPAGAATSYVINTNYGFVHLLRTGTTWNVVGSG